MLFSISQSRPMARYLRDASGATAIEYGLIVAIIAIGAIVGFQTLSDSIETEFTEISGAFSNATGAAVDECTADGSC